MAAKDLPSIPPSVSPDLRDRLERLREETRRLLGFVGDKLDSAVTWRQLVAQNLVTLEGVSVPAGSSPGTINIPSGTSSSTPDLTPPPSVTGLAVTAAMTHVIITTDAPTYTVGHGPGSTRIYAAKRNPGDPAAVFSDAVLVDEVFGAVTVIAVPSDLNIRWHIWAKWKSVDGVESTSPAGGTNGVIATTGQIGSSQLGPLVVLAGNLAAGAVTTDKTALDLGGDNLLANNSFEVDSNSDGLADGWGIYNNDGAGAPTTASLTAGRITGNAQRVTWTGTNATSKGVAVSAGGGIRGGAWTPNKTYVVSFYARGNAAQAFGMQLAWNTAPATTTAIKNPNLTTSWQRYAFRITWGASVEVSPASGLFATCLYGSAWANGWLEFDDFQIEEGDTLSGYQGKLALNTIVAGDGAIANLAITNALIANAAIDDAKVANLSAAKLTVGDGTVGGDLKSTNYVAGSSGWILRPSGAAQFPSQYIIGLVTASQIDSRGLSIKDSFGNVILAAGSPLDAANITPSSGWLNSNVSISAGGVLSGAGGGTVTISGLDSTVVRSANPITAANISTYIAAAAIGSAQIGSLSVGLMSTAINGGASTGARVEMASNVIRVYDSSNVLRVKIGNLA